MSGVLIVAGEADAGFAAEVREITRGLDIESAPSLPAGEQRTVLLVWSAARPASAGDVPALIELWSQGRLVIARRDDTLLPLGLGDLETVPAEAPARDTALKLLHAALAPGEGIAASRPSPDMAPPTVEAPVAAARPAGRWQNAAALGVVVLALFIGGVWVMMREAAPPLLGSRGASPPPDVLTAPSSLPPPAVKSAAEREVEAKLQDERQRLAFDREARSAVPQRPSPPPSMAPGSPAPSAAPPPSSNEETRIAELERQLAELKRERTAADAKTAPAPAPHPVPIPKAAPPDEFPWATLGAAALVALAAGGLWLLRRTRRPVELAAAGQTVSIEAVAAAVVAMPPPPLADALFVSYAHHDLSRVDPLVSQIEAMGRTVWIDRVGMTGGPGWAGQITRAIKGSRAVVLMASPSAYASDQVVRELYLAMGAKKLIVPIELEPAELPDELAYILAPFQRHAVQSGDTRTMLSRALAAI